MALRNDLIPVAVDDQQRLVDPPDPVEIRETVARQPVQPGHRERAGERRFQHQRQRPAPRRQPHGRAGPDRTAVDHDRLRRDLLFNGQELPAAFDVAVCRRFRRSAGTFAVPFVVVCENPVPLCMVSRNPIGRRRQVLGVSVAVKQGEAALRGRQIARADMPRLLRQFQPEAAGNGGALRRRLENDPVHASRQQQQGANQPGQQNDSATGRLPFLMLHRRIFPLLSRTISPEKLL